MSIEAQAERPEALTVPGSPVRALWRPELDTVWAWLPHALVACIAVPFIVRQNSWSEWANTLWLLDLQTAHVSAHGLPSFFIDAAGSYFYPQMLFYAGPTLATLAYPSVVLGTWPVFAAATAFSFGAASFGVSWTARNLGVPPRLAVVPGVLFATTPYMVSNLYGRGDWAEVLAVGCFAVALGAGTSLLCGRARSQPAMMGVLALAVAGVAGTHNLTLLFGALFAPLVAIGLTPLIRGSRRLILRRYALVCGAALVGLALCGVFLVPNVWLASRTFIGRGSGIWDFLTKINGFDGFSVIFDPLPGQPTAGAGTYVHTETLVLPLIWCLTIGSAAVARRRLERRTALALGLLGVGAIAVTLLITDPSWWHSFPPWLRAIQFPFRLVTFLALLTVIMVAVLLSAPAVRKSRLTIGMLLAAVVWQIGVAGYLALSAQPRGSTTALAPGSIRANVVPKSYAWGQQVAYRLATDHPIQAPPQEATVAPIGEDGPPVIRLSGSQPVGSLIATRVVASPLIRFAGDATVIGATLDGFNVLRVARSPWRVTVQSACNTCITALGGHAPLALLVGRVASLAGVVALLALMTVALAGRRGRPRPSGPS
jgi:hypothetical protein